MNQLTEPTKNSSEAIFPSPSFKSNRYLRIPLWHLLISIFLAGCTAALVFYGWYPFPFRELGGGFQLFWMVIGVDVICGPLLTLILFKPNKSFLALSVDLTLIALIQISALIYGVHTLSYARPLALVYEVDRFRVISFADIPEDEISSAPAWVKPWAINDVRVVGIRKSKTLDEKVSNIDASLQGVEPSQRPQWWQDYKLSVPAILERAKPLAELRQKHPGDAALITKIANETVMNIKEGETKDAESLRWLPVVSRHSLSWIALIDPVTGRPRGYLPLSGF